MQIKCFEDFNRLPESYTSLFDEAEIANFDSGRDWYAHLAATALSPDDCVLLYGIELDEGHPVAALPLHHLKNKRALFSLSTFYSALYVPLVAQGQQDEALTTLFKSLRGAEQDWASLRLNPMPKEQPIYEATIRALKNAGWLPFSYYCFGNWYLSVEGRSYSEYSEALPSRIRNTIKRKSRHFYSRAGGKLEIVTGNDSVDRAIEAYNKIYLSSWKKPEPFPDFIPCMIRLFANKDQLRLGIAYTNDIPVAAQIWIVSHGRAAIYKLAYDENYSDLSAGSILTEHLMRHVIDVDKVHEIDYLIGDDAYKKDWMNHRRERWGIMAYNPRTLAGLLGSANEIVRRTVKTVLNRFGKPATLENTFNNFIRHKGAKHVDP